MSDYLRVTVQIDEPFLERLQRLKAIQEGVSPEDVYGKMHSYPEAGIGFDIFEVGKEFAHSVSRHLPENQYDRT